MGQIDLFKYHWYLIEKSSTTPSPKKQKQKKKKQTLEKNDIKNQTWTYDQVIK